MPFHPHRACRLAVAAAACLIMAGCGGPTRFAPNHVYLKRQEHVAKVELSVDQRQDIQELLAILFGTPDGPLVPKLEDVDAGQVLDVELLKVAAGPVRSDEQGRQFGLYREHCATCHGVTGDGLGPSAGFLSPYPRDFRRGVFKYKSTIGPSTPPTREDLLRLLADGNAGSSMPSFRLLEDQELAALVEYVKYLSIRGEVERALIFESVDQLEDEHDRLVDLSLREEAPRRFDEEMGLVRELTAGVVQRWVEAADQLTPILPKPSGWDLAASIRSGRELYLGDVANCVKCHGQQGLGDGQNDDYDDWSREILDPMNPSAARRYVALGALPPFKLRPRNLRQGIFRGGSRPEDIFLRIHNGIAGTPMPAASMRPENAPAGDKRLDAEDVWNLVDYVQSLSADREQRGSDQAPSVAVASRAAAGPSRSTSGPRSSRGAYGSVSIDSRPKSILDGASGTP